MSKEDSEEREFSLLFRFREFAVVHLFSYSFEWEMLWLADTGITFHASSCINLRVSLAFSFLDVKYWLSSIDLTPREWMSEWDEEGWRKMKRVKRVKSIVDGDSLLFLVARGLILVGRKVVHGELSGEKVLLLGKDSS